MSTEERAGVNFTPVNSYTRFRINWRMDKDIHPGQNMIFTLVNVDNVLKFTFLSQIVRRNK